MRPFIAGVGFVALCAVIVTGCENLPFVIAEPTNRPAVRELFSYETKACRFLTDVSVTLSYQPGENAQDTATQRLMDLAAGRGGNGIYIWQTSDTPATSAAKQSTLSVSARVYACGARTE